MKFTLVEHYEPGHVEMYYSNGLLVLARLEPDETPVDGDYMAEYTVNGKWSFEILSQNEKAPLAEEYSNTDKITPAIEDIIKEYKYSDGASFNVDGFEYTFNWRNNNWFELFIYKYENGEWEEQAFALDEGPEVGPTADEMQESLQGYIDDTIDNEENKEEYLDEE